jgi:hypothetical protein
VPSTVDPQQRRFLALLERAGGEPVSYADLRAGGVGFPAAVAAELELIGFMVERSTRPGGERGLRVIGPNQTASATAPPARRWRR